MRGLLLVLEFQHCSISLYLDTQIHRHTQCVENHRAMCIVKRCSIVDICIKLMFSSTQPFALATMLP